MKKFLFVLFCTVCCMIGQESIFAQTKKGNYIPSKFDTIIKVVPQQVYGNPKAQRREDSLARFMDSLDRLALEAQKQEEARLAEIRRKEEEQRQQNNRAEKKSKTTKSGHSKKKENTKKQVNEAENRKDLEEKARLNQLAEDAAVEARKRKSLRSQWTLEDCVLYAKENNLSVAENALNERLAKLVLEQNKVSRLPNLNADFSLGESYGRSIDPTSNQFVTSGFLYNTTGLSSQVLLFGWFQKKYQIEQSQLDLYASEYAFKQLKEDIALNVATGFLRVLLAREQVRINEVQLKADQEQYEQTQKFVQSGKLPELNAAQMLAQVSSDSAALLSAVTNEKIALLQLKALMNLSFEQPFEIILPDLNMAGLTGPGGLPNPDEVYATALQQQYRTKMNQLKLLSAKKMLDIAKAQQYPQLSLFANLGTNFSSNVKDITGQRYLGEVPLGNINIAGSSYAITRPDYDYDTRTRPFFTQYGDNIRANIGLSLSIPIFNAYAARTNIQKAKIGLVSQQIAADNDKLKLRQDILTAYEEAKAAAQKYVATRRSEEASKRAFNFAVKRFEIGMINTYEYTATQSALYNASSSVLSAKYDLIFKLKVLDYYMGNPLKL